MRSWPGSAVLLTGALCLSALWLSSAAQQPPAPKKKGGRQLPTVEASAEQKQQIEARLGELDVSLSRLKAGSASSALLADVDIYSKAGHWLLEFPGFFDEQDIAHLVTVLDRGLERARQLERGESPWLAQKGRK